MADLIQIKRGDTTGVSFLADGELGYSRGEKALYIGDGGRRNQKLCSAETATRVDALETKVATLENEKLTATAMESIGELSSDSDMGAVITAYNSLLSALKSSGIMKQDEVT